MIALRFNIMALVLLILVFGGFVQGDTADLFCLGLALFAAVSSIIFSRIYEKQYRGYNLTVSSLIIAFILFSVFWAVHMHSVVREQARQALEKEVAEMETQRKRQQQSQENVKTSQ